MRRLAVGSLRLLMLAANTARAQPTAEDQHVHPAGDPSQLGRVHFPVSCTPPAQEKFDLAVAILHSFWYEESEKAFAEVVDADPRCVMGYWGIAMSLYHPLWEPPREVPRVQAFLEKARAIGGRTDREREFLGAIDVIYRDADTVPLLTRARAWEKAHEQIHLRYPKDHEAAIFYGLALLATAAPTDKTYANQIKAGALLEEILPEEPGHPGLAHYIIHAYDFPELALHGFAAAHAYARIAPAVPHAQHMPSHIFVRVGLWDETIAANQRAFQSGYDYAQAQHTGVAPEQLHALDYMVYAYLQQGRDRDARRIIAQALELQTTLTNDAMVADYNRVAMEARLPLERGDWAEAARLPVRGAPLTIGAALAHFARAIGAARTADTAQAHAEITALASIEADITRRGDNDWARVVGIKRQIATAWAELAVGDTTAALRDAKAAADLEDVTEKQPVTPGELLPARELEGDMLLAAGRYAAAQIAYETALAREPNRARSLYGSARAAELAGDRAGARRRYDEFLGQLKSGDGDRAEIARARTALR